VAARITAALLLVAVTAGAETRQRYGGKIVASLLSGPASWDPLEARSHAEVTLAGLVFDGLYGLDERGQVVPRLAAAPPSFSANGLEAHIELRPGVLWHDNKPVRAADVVASLTRARGHWALAPVAKVARDKDQVVLTLRRATPELAELLATPQLAITQGGKAPTARAYVGTGPFSAKIAAGERRVDLLAFPEHWAGRPYLDRVKLRWFTDADAEARAYEAGESDASLRGQVAFAGHTPKYATATVEGTATTLVYLGFGKAHAIDSRIELRRALSLAMNRAALKNVGSGERVVPALLPESPDLGGRAVSAADAAARLADARAALDGAGKTGDRLEVLVDATRPEDGDIAGRVVKALDELGVAASWRAVEPAELEKLIDAGRYDIVVGQLVAPGADVRWEYAAAFAAGGDDWAETALRKGAFALADARKEFAARLPIVPLVHRAVKAHHKKTLAGVAFDGLGRLGWADVSVVK
jgi:peptide/nickel transport system substrate-binding protein